MRFRLVLSQLAILKISDLAMKYATFVGNFLCFHGKNILASALKKMHSILKGEKTKKTHSIVSCFTKGTSPRDLYIMTWITEKVNEE